MSVTEDLLDGLIGTLVAAGIGVYATPPAVYAATDTALVLGRTPTTPDRCVVLNDYPLSDNPSLPMGEVGVQFKMRGLPNSIRDAMRLRDSIYVALNGLEHQQYGTAHANHIYRFTSVPPGQDDSNRFVYIDSYHVDVDYPSTVNRH